MKMLLTNVRVVTAEGVAPGAILINGDTIEQVFCGADAETVDVDVTIDCHGALAMPGAIDTHVHFRDPGLTSKADWGTESRAAAAGGVTSVIDMPNTLPQTVTIEAVAEKMRIAAERSVVNYSCFIGASADNIDDIRHADYTRVAGVKLFLGSTTGDMMLADDAAIERLLDAVPTGVPVVVHAESEAVIQHNLRNLNPDNLDDLPVRLHPQIRSAQACFASSHKIVEQARRHNTRLHLAHISTADELALLDADKPLQDKQITSETCPQYLRFCADDFDRLGARIKCNPAIKSAEHRRALVAAVKSGLVDTIATDHAPHLLADKEGGALKAKSGMPMVQFSLPLMLDMFEPQCVAQAMSAAPATIFGIERRGAIAPGNYADIAIVAETEPYTIADGDVISKCGWTPLCGTTLRHRVEMTIVNGRIIYARGQGNPLYGAGKALQFRVQFGKSNQKV